MLQAERLPRKRILVLLGKAGSVKREIESATKTRLKIDMAGDVEVSGEVEGVLTATNIVKAIGRGFSKEDAFLLLNEKNQINVITLQGETEKTTKRLMSRVIGREGKAKRRLEQLTNTNICVFGKTIAIIGEEEGIEKASSGVEDLLAGRKHAFVYAKIEKMNRF